jgi:hypothetical protein
MQKSGINWGRESRSKSLHLACRVIGGTPSYFLREQRRERGIAVEHSQQPGLGCSAPKHFSEATTSKV